LRIVLQQLWRVDGDHVVTVHLWHEPWNLIACKVMWALVS